MVRAVGFALLCWEMRLRIVWLIYHVTLVEAVKGSMILLIEQLDQRSVKDLFNLHDCCN